VRNPGLIGHTVRAVARGVRQDTHVADLWRSQGTVCGGIFHLTIRLSIWRSFTQPVYQLEGVTDPESQGASGSYGTMAADPPRHDAFAISEPC
jgi:hypothetical protein